MDLAFISPNLAGISSRLEAACALPDMSDWGGRAMDKTEVTARPDASGRAADFVRGPAWGSGSVAA